MGLVQRVLQNPAPRSALYCTLSYVVPASIKDRFHRMLKSHIAQCVKWNLPGVQPHYTAP